MNSCVVEWMKFDGICFRETNYFHFMSSWIVVEFRFESVFLAKTYTKDIGKQKFGRKCERQEKLLRLALGRWYYIKMIRASGANSDDDADIQNV